MASYWDTHQDRITQLCSSIRDNISGDHDIQYCDGESPRYMDGEDIKYTRCGQTSYFLNGHLQCHSDTTIYSDDHRNSIETIIRVFKEKLLDHGTIIISIETIGGSRTLDHIFTLYQDHNSVKIVDSYVKFWLPRIRDLNWIDFENNLGELINIIQKEPNGDANEPDGAWTHRSKYMMVYSIWAKLWSIPVYKNTMHWFPIRDVQIKYWISNKND